VRGAIKWAVIVFVLVVVQGQLAGFGHDFPLIAALHGLNALALFGAAMYAGRRLRAATAAALKQPEARTTAPV
jgi:F0F1-type ATP synthase membrane subunit c/vacuolar-type H+-ATPase subunit K